MLEKKKTNISQIIAGILILFSLLVDFYVSDLYFINGRISRTDYYIELVRFMGMLISSIGISLNKKKIFYVGVIIWMISPVWKIITISTSINPLDDSFIPNLYFNIAQVIQLILIFLAIKINNKNSLTFGILSAITFLIVQVIVSFLHKKNLSSSLFYIFIYPLKICIDDQFVMNFRNARYMRSLCDYYLLPISYILIGISFSKGADKYIVSGSSKTNTIEQLEQLKELYDKGILTEDEFKDKKAKLLGD